MALLTAAPVWVGVEPEPEWVADGEEPEEPEPEVADPEPEVVSEPEVLDGLEPVVVAVLSPLEEPVGAAVGVAPGV